MISDAICDAVDEIDYYLSEPAFAGCYVGEIRDEIVRVREEMDRLRIRLDEIPGPEFNLAVAKATKPAGD